MPFKSFRALFPQFNHWTYLDSAMQGLTPPAIAKAGARAIYDQVTPYASDSHSLAAGVREKIAQLLRVHPAEIALTGSTTQGLNMVASSLDIKAGDNVVVSAWEHPSNLYPWTNLQRLGVEVRLVQSNDGILRLGDYIPHVDKRTKVIAASLVSFYPGGVLDAREFASLAHANGALLVLDAAQAVGFMPVHPLDISADIIVAPSYKGLMSGHSGGFIYIRQDLLSALKPSHLYIRGAKGSHGIWGGLTDINYKLADSAALLEANTVPEATLAQMDRALTVLLELGAENIFAHSQRLAADLARGLSSLGFVVEPGAPSHIVSVRHEGAKEIEGWLKHNNVAASARRYGLRFGLYAYNNEADVARALAIIEQWRG